MQVHVEVFDRFQDAVSPRWLQRAARAALTAAQAEDHGPLELVVADDETVRKLNREYRGLDETTDVLAFSFQHPGEYYGEGPPPTGPAESFVLPPQERPGLGEVILSYPQVVRQAREQGRPVERELALMVVHGVLHLLGYDHLEAQEEAVMRDLERKAMNRLFPGETQEKEG